MSGRGLHVGFVRRGEGGDAPEKLTALLEEVAIGWIDHHCLDGSSTYAWVADYYGPAKRYARDHGVWGPLVRPDGEIVAFFFTDFTGQTPLGSIAYHHWFRLAFAANAERLRRMASELGLELLLDPESAEELASQLTNVPLAEVGGALQVLDGYSDPQLCACRGCSLLRERARGPYFAPEDQLIYALDDDWQVIVGGDGTLDLFEEKTTTFEELGALNPIELARLLDDVREARLEEIDPLETTSPQVAHAQGRPPPSRRIALHRVGKGGLAADIVTGFEARVPTAVALRDRVLGLLAHRRAIRARKRWEHRPAMPTIREQRLRSEEELRRAALGDRGALAITLVEREGDVERWIELDALVVRRVEWHASPARRSVSVLGRLAPRDPCAIAAMLVEGDLVRATNAKQRTIALRVAGRQRTPIVRWLDVAHAPPALVDAIAAIRRLASEPPIPAKARARTELVFPAFAAEPRSVHKARSIEPWTLPLHLVVIGDFGGRRDVPIEERPLLHPSQDDLVRVPALARLMQAVAESGRTDVVVSRIDATHDEVRDDFDDYENERQSGLFLRLITGEHGGFGGRPVDALLSLWDAIEPRTIERIGRVLEHGPTPFVTQNAIETGEALVRAFREDGLCSTFGGTFVAGRIARHFTPFLRAGVLDLQAISDLPRELRRVLDDQIGFPRPLRELFITVEDDQAGVRHPRFSLRVTTMSGVEGAIEGRMVLDEPLAIAVEPEHLLRRAIVASTDGAWRGLTVASGSQSLGIRIDGSGDAFVTEHHPPVLREIALGRASGDALERLARALHGDLETTSHATSPVLRIRVGDAERTIAFVPTDLPRRPALWLVLERLFEAVSSAADELDEVPALLASFRDEIGLSSTASA